MSHRTSTHEPDPDDIDINNLYNLKGSSNTGSGGSDPLPWLRPSAPTAIALIIWGLAAILARFVHVMDPLVNSFWSSRSDFSVSVEDVVRTTTGVEFLLAVVGALSALALVGIEADRGRTGVAVVNIVLAGLALSVFLNGWIVLLFESPVRLEVWVGGLLMGICLAIALTASIVELGRSAARRARSRERG